MKNEIYFSNYFTEEIIQKINENTIGIIQDSSNLRESTIKNDREKNNYSIEEREQLFRDSLKRKWKKMKLISGFNKNCLISFCITDYFKRPFSSHFLHSQNLKLYSFNSCIPLPKVLCKYPIKLDIEFHLESIFAHNEGNNQYSFQESCLIAVNKDKEDITLFKNNLQQIFNKENMSLSHYNKDVSLINVYD